MYFMKNLMELIRSGESKNIQISFHGEKVELEYISKNNENDGLKIDCWSDIKSIEQEISLLLGEKTIDKN